MTNFSIQMVDGLTIFALSMAGYDAHFLQRTLEKKEVEESIHAPETAAQQDRLAIVHRYGRQFHMPIGVHVMDNNIFIAFEMKDHKKARARS